MSHRLRSPWPLRQLPLLVLLLGTFGGLELQAAQGGREQEVAAPSAVPKWAKRVLEIAGPKGVVYVLDGQGQVLLEKGTDSSFLPASTLKLFTAQLAMERLGKAHRFTTDFFEHEGFLVVRGRGDPFLVSEELDLAAPALVELLGGRELSGVLVDNSYFAQEISIPGVGVSDEPYDALNAATAVNFNTVSVSVKNGTVRSDEEQTPLTPLAREVAVRRQVRGKARLNLSADPKDVLRYASEMIAAKLRQHGAKVGEEWGPGEAPEGEPLYVHRSSKSLSELCSSMLVFSNNFIANQLFLAVGAAVHGAPATLEKGVRAAEVYIEEHPEFSGFRVTEGSGISYDNRVTAKAMAALLAAFVPHIELLKVHEGSPHKTGTLRVTKTLAGYLDSKTHGQVRYVLALDGGGYFKRWEIVKLLRGAL